MKPPPFPNRDAHDWAQKFPVSPKMVLLIPLVLFLLIGLFMSYYTVSTESVGVVKRFGKYHQTVSPGLHFKLPFGIDSVAILPTKRQLKLEFGFSTANATNPDQFSMEPELERNMVTGDLNAAQVEWILQYSITDPKDFLFRYRNPASTLRDLTESVVSEVIGDRTIDEVLTIGRTEIELQSLSRLISILQTVRMGITPETIQLKNVNPPDQVQASFNDVNRAQQEREKSINQANGSYNQVIPKARGQADQRISAADGYALQRINEAKGDVARFVELLTFYEKAPDVTRQRLYLETMEKLLPQIGKKVIIDEDLKSFLPFLNLTPTPSEQ
ncbi:MAG: FtsH protease activity modulator HflK [Verrucomicrobia bacterium]|nr:MAG: FtsH protease activity modulator HflK [Verrucomicrobiota bacterium]